VTPLSVLGFCVPGRKEVIDVTVVQDSRTQNLTPSLVYFSSVSENTKRFVEKLEVDAARIPVRRTEEELVVNQPYVLVVPTYGGEIDPETGRVAGAVPKQVIRFLNNESNRRFIRGVIVAGNRNFGEAYCAAGRVISAKCNVPVLYTFELMGTPDDVTNVRDGLRRFWSEQPTGEER
jgi:protein involved in ribonucleotide reduction